MKSPITRTVWILSLVSLFTDVASEMLYPVMPVYLQSIGFSVVFIGLLEGVAEATAGLSKGYFGKLSDAKGKRLPFVRAGYLLSALSKPMLAVSTLPLLIFGARTVDRLGKGIRTGARDAMLSDQATPETKGRVFGFHRSLDTFGAVLGPVSALIYLHYFPGDYTRLFYLAFLPGVISVTFTRLLKDRSPQPRTEWKAVSFFAFVGYWRTSPPTYRRIVGGLLVFALFNSSDVFLLLRLKQAGMGDTEVIGAYIFYNLVFALTAYPVGILADRLGLQRTLLFGLVLFALVYLGMAWNQHPLLFYGLFFLYGIYAASTEGIAKAWISNVSDRKDAATAIGTYAGLNSLCAMGASALAGLVWYRFGAAATFSLTAAITLGVVGYFMLLKE